MCGRFAQSQTREDYLALLAEDIERDIPYDPEPIGRYNVAPGTKVLLLSERDEHLHLDPVFWGYAPGWWDKPPLINARVETAATSRMFKPLWQHGRAICFADGWFEWKKEGDKKQPYFIYRADGQPVFMAAIGSTPFERGDEAEGFLIVTAAADQGLVDIHDRRPPADGQQVQRIHRLLHIPQHWKRRRQLGRQRDLSLLPGASQLRRPDHSVRLRHQGHLLSHG